MADLTHKIEVGIVGYVSETPVETVIDGEPCVVVVMGIKREANDRTYRDYIKAGFFGDHDLDEIAGLGRGSVLDLLGDLKNYKIPLVVDDEEVYNGDGDLVEVELTVVRVTDVAFIVKKSQRGQTPGRGQGGQRKRSGDDTDNSSEKGSRKGLKEFVKGRLNRGERRQATC